MIPVVHHSYGLIFNLDLYYKTCFSYEKAWDYSIGLTYKLKLSYIRGTELRPSTSIRKSLKIVNLEFNSVFYIKRTRSLEDCVDLCHNISHLPSENFMICIYFYNFIHILSFDFLEEEIEIKASTT